MITIEQIKQLHRKILINKNSYELNAGKFKEKNNIVKVPITKHGIIIEYATTDKINVETELNFIIDLFKIEIKNKKIKKTKSIGNFIFSFIKIHPFEDGNGRLSRQLLHYLFKTYCSDVHNFYDIEKYITKHKKSYNNSINKCRKIETKEFYTNKFFIEYIQGLELLLRCKGWLKKIFSY